MPTLPFVFRALSRKASTKNSFDVSSVSDITESPSSNSFSAPSVPPADFSSTVMSEMTDNVLRSAKNIKGACLSSTEPKPAFVLPLLETAETSELLAVSGSLGVDQSSQHFANRTKSIAFVLCVSGKWFQINQDYFNQASEYNDFSGGYKRFYDELPRGFIQSAVTQRLLTNFTTVYGIPEGELILAQVQSSNISPANEGKCLTGQGIHSDGADRAMLVCLERDNVIDARSSVYEDTEGEEPVIDRHTLEEGQVLFWKDNEVYHYVEPARLDDRAREGTRTVLIAHYPAMHYITGRRNPNNSLEPSGKHPPYLSASRCKQACPQHARVRILL